MSAVYSCASCGGSHDDLPFSYHTGAPDHWSDDAEAHPASELGSDQCIINGDQFFVRGLIRIEVVDDTDDFEWGVWVSVSPENFDVMDEQWDVEGRESSEAAFGWLATELPGYTPSTLNLKTMVHTRPVGLRPWIELEPTGHPLAVQQREGVTRRWVEAMASTLLHD